MTPRILSVLLSFIFAGAVFAQDIATIGDQGSGSIEIASGRAEEAIYQCASESQQTGDTRVEVVVGGRCETDDHCGATETCRGGRCVGELTQDCHAD